MYLAPQNIPRTISVLTLGNKVILYCKLENSQRGACVVGQTDMFGLWLSLETVS